MGVGRGGWRSGRCCDGRDECIYNDNTQHVGKKKTPNPNINFAMGTDSKYNITTRYYKPDVSIISYLLARDGVDVKPDAGDDRRVRYICGSIPYYIVHFYLILV